jgi:hypothetical protein
LQVSEIRVNNANALVISAQYGNEPRVEDVRNFGDFEMVEPGAVSRRSFKERTKNIGEYFAEQRVSLETAY